MTVYSVITNNGSIVADSYNYQVKKSLSDNNSSSSFSAHVENYAGRNASSFSVGNEIIVYGDTTPIVTPVVEWNFNTSGTTIYDSNGNPGSAISGVNWGSGLLGSAVLLGSPSYVNVPLASVGSFIGSLTVAAWIKPAYVKTGSNHPIMANPRTVTANGWAFSLNGSNIRFTTYGFNDFDFLTQPIPAGSWSHVAATKVAGSINFYYNGSYIATSTNASTGSINTDDPFYIGASTAGLSAVITSYFSGLIDDLRVYNSTLGSTQIKQIYNSGLGTEFTGPIAPKIFDGILENLTFEGEGQKEEIVLEGRDFTARLVDRTVEPETYTNWDIGSITLDIVKKYTSDIGSTYLGSIGQTLPRIAFRHTPVYDAIRQLADLAGYSFYVDVNKQLHFAPTGSTSSGYNLVNGSNVIRGDFSTDRESLYNQVWVYGDRYLDGYKETFTAGSPLNGSVFTLLYNPHNTEVTVSGAVIQPGAIQNLSTTPASGTRYLVNYDDKTITFLSGTSYGSNVPTSGNQVIVNYKRALPIVKVGDNQFSEGVYSQRNKIIIDKDIKDPQTAQKVLEEQLAALANPKIEGNLDLRGVFNIDPSQTVEVNMPNHNISGVTYTVIEANYDFSKENNLKDQVLSVKLNQRIGDVTDTLKDMILQQRKAQAQDMTDTDLITRFQYNTGSLGIRQSGLQIWTRQINDSFIVGHPLNGIMGVLRPEMIGSINSPVWVNGSGQIWSGLQMGSTAASAKYVLLTNSGSLSPVSGLTVSAWVNLGTIYQGGNARFVKKEAGVPRNGWDFNWFDGSPALSTVGIQIYSGGGQFLLSGAPAGGFATGTWYHMASTYNGSNQYAYVYVNGSQVSSGLATQFIGSGTSNGLIGANTTTGDFALSGQIADVRIYNVPLTSQEIGSLYNLGEVTRGAVAFYRLREGNGSFAYNGLSGGCSWQPLMGDRRGGSTLVWSGGYF